MFAYFSSSVGALFLHLATSNFLYTNGRVLGCSSITYGSVANPNPFNLPVTVGIGAGALLVKQFLPQYVPDYGTVAAIAPFGAITPLIGGLLTGIGTKFGSGCTSGHMLCGLARGSVRSLVASATFCTVAAITSYLLQTAPDCGPVPCHTLVHPSQDEVTLLSSMTAIAVVTTVVLRQVLKPGSKVSQAISSFYSGLLFAAGLVISGLANPANTLGFLALAPPKFNPSLLMVMVFGVLPNAVEILYRGYNLPQGAAVSEFSLPSSTKITPSLVVGSAIFGIGWGLSGICPGPGVVSAFLNGYQGLTWLGAFLGGYFVATNIS